MNRVACTIFVQRQPAAKLEVVDVNSQADELVATVVVGGAGVAHGLHSYHEPRGAACRYKIL